MAPCNEETLQQLRVLHPQAPIDRQFKASKVEGCIQATSIDILHAIQTFPNGSGAGPDGFKPQFLKDLTSNKELEDQLIQSITALINIYLVGRCPSIISPRLLGGRLLAIQKKQGGKRPI